MNTYHRSSLALIAVFAIDSAFAQNPPHQQPGALEECLQYITSTFDGGREYCHNSCEMQNKAFNLDSRCKAAGKLNLLDCTAYREVACDQSQPGIVGVSSATSGSGSNTPDTIPPHQLPGALEECVTYITSSFDGGLEYCHNSCEMQSKAFNLDSRCKAAGKVNLLDCTAYREVACDQSQPGVVGVASTTGSSASNASTNILPHQQPGALEECLNYITSTFEGGLEYCHNSCEMQNKAFNLDTRCQAAGKINLLDCTAYREVACDQTQAGVIGVESSSTPSGSTPPHQQPGALEECMNYITSSFDGGLEYCHNSCEMQNKAYNLDSRCQSAGKVNLLDCTAYREVACEQSRAGEVGVGGGSGSATNEVTSCQQALRLVDGANLNTTYCADRCSYFAQDLTFKEVCKSLNYATLADCIDFIEPACEKKNSKL